MLPKPPQSSGALRARRASRGSDRSAIDGKPRRGRGAGRPARGPGRPRAGDVDPEQVRERLLEAAAALAAAQGFETCGLREIAARAQVSPAMVAYYFGDRAGLAEALYRRTFERVSTRVQALVDSPEFVRRDGVEELVSIHVAAMMADPWLPKLIASELLAHGASPLRSRLFQDLTRGPLMAMVGWIEAEQREGRLRADIEARWLALSIASLSVFPFLITPITGPELGLVPGPGFAEELTAHVQQILAHGLRARSEVPS